MLAPAGAAATTSSSILKQKLFSKAFKITRTHFCTLRPGECTAAKNCAAAARNQQTKTLALLLQLCSYCTQKMTCQYSLQLLMAGAFATTCLPSWPSIATAAEVICTACC